MAEKKSHRFGLSIIPIRWLDRRLLLLNRGALALQVALALFRIFLFYHERDFDHGVKGIDTLHGMG